MSPPTRPILRLMWSIASSRDGTREQRRRSVITSSSTIGSDVTWRTARHSSRVGHGCSSRNRSDRAISRAAMIASWRRQPPLASPITSSSGPVAASDRGRPSRVVRRVGAQLQLEPVHAPGALARHEGGHLLRRPERHRHVQRQLVLEDAAEEGGYRQVDEPAEGVPAGHVQRTLGVLMTAQPGVHPPVDVGKIGGVGADERGRELADRNPRPLTERREVGAAQRTHFPEALRAVSGGDPDHRAWQPGHLAPGRHDVVTVRIGQHVAEDIDALDRRAPAATHVRRSVDVRHEN